MPDQPLLEEGYRYEETQATAFAFERLLAQHNISIKPGTLLERAVLQVVDIIYRKDSGGTIQAATDIRESYRSLVGVNELAGLVMEVRNHPDFGQLVPHLRLLNEGSALQNVASSQVDGATQKLFELFAASLAMQCGANVVVDSPVHATGLNPDVLADLCGERWGIACKVIHSLHPEAIIQNIEKGVDQIEKSPATVGIVILNLKNVLNYEELWPCTRAADLANDTPAEYAVFPDQTVPFELLKKQMLGIGGRLKAHLPAGYIESAFQGKKSVGGFILWGHAMTGVLVNGKATATSLRIMSMQRVLAISESNRHVLERLNWAAFPDSPTRGPQPPC